VIPYFFARGVVAHSPQSAEGKHTTTGMFLAIMCVFAFCRYLSTRVLPMQGKKKRTALKRMAKRFGLIGESK